MPDIVGVLNAQDDYTRNRNYWKYLKTKLKKDGSEVVSGTNQLKLRDPDGKSKANAYTLFESSLLKNIEVGTVKGRISLSGGITSAPISQPFEPE